MVAGTARDSDGNTQFALARYAADGSLDRLFDSDGKVLTDFPASDTGAAALREDDEQRLVVGGYAWVGRRWPRRMLALARYNRDGSLDRSFNGGGKIFHDLPELSGEGVAALGIASGNRPVISASAQGRTAFLRLEEDGSLDRSFGDRGVVTTEFPAIPWINGSDMEIDRNNRVVFSSPLGPQRQPVPWHANVLYPSKLTAGRILESGDLDAGFGDDGIAEVDLASRGLLSGFATSIGPWPSGDGLLFGFTAIINR